MNKITKAHVNNFAGQDKTLLTYDNMEKEESFLIYENGHLNKQEGYYIYYEKNEEMQTYMIEQKKTESEEATYDDKVSREIREVIQNKKPVVEENKSVTRLMYAAGTLLAVIILVVGAAMLSNYDQMKNMQKALDSLSQSLTKTELPLGQNEAEAVTAEVHNEDLKDPTENTDKPNDSLDVEVVPGNVDPIEDDENKDTVPEEELADQEKGEDKEPDETQPIEDEPDEKPEEQNQEQKPEEKDTQKEEEKEEKEASYYTVKEGDSLIGISFKLYNSANYMKKIMELNDIEDEDLIYVGQRLIVP
jgi:LysM repeat protein